MASKVFNEESKNTTTNTFTNDNSHNVNNYDKYIQIDSILNINTKDFDDIKETKNVTTNENMNYQKDFLMKEILNDNIYSSKGELCNSNEQQNEISNF
jgi:hypothetical protein